MFVSASHSVYNEWHGRHSVGWLARIAQTQQSWGDKFVIREEFLRPCNRKITTKLYRDNCTLGGVAIAHTAASMDPPLLATVVTFRSLCERTTECVCPSSVSNSSAAQSNSSSWTQKKVFRPCFVVFSPGQLLAVWLTQYLLFVSVVCTTLLGNKWLIDWLQCGSTSFA